MLHKYYHITIEKGRLFLNTYKSINCGFYCTQVSDMEVGDGTYAARGCGPWDSQLAGLGRLKLT